MKTNILKTSHVNGAITFSEEEKEIFQKAHSIIRSVVVKMNESGNFKDKFERLSVLCKKDGTEEFFRIEETLKMLESLKNLDRVEYEYDEL